MHVIGAAQGMNAPALLKLLSNFTGLHTDAQIINQMRSANQCEVRPSSEEPSDCPPSPLAFGRRAAPARAARRAPPPSTPHLPPPAGSLCEEEAAVLHEARRLQRLPGGTCGPRARQATGVHTPPRRPPRTVTPPTRALPPSSHAALRPGRPQLDAFFAPYNELLRELVHPDFHWSDATHAHARRLSQM